MNNICMEIYEENKERIQWYLTKKCPWLSNAEKYVVMREIWEVMSENIQELSEWNQVLRWKWLTTVAYSKADKFRK